MPENTSEKSISTIALNTSLQSATPPTVFDVRKKPAVIIDPNSIPGASWQIHDDVKNWAKALPANQPIVVYCVHGHEVSQNAAQGLRDLGFNACYLEGGIDEWKQAGLPVKKGAE